jgi:hypothetical protein
MKGRETLPYLLDRTGLIGAEIGVETAAFSKYLLDTGLFERLYSIDPWAALIPGVTQDGEQYYSENAMKTYLLAKDTLRMYGDQSRILRTESAKAVKYFEGAAFDFIFLDGDHTTQGVKLDLETWWPKIKVGGMLAGHDYFDVEMDCGSGIISNFGVKTAVDRFVAENGLQLYIVEEPNDALQWLPAQELPQWASWYILKQK